MNLQLLTKNWKTNTLGTLALAYNALQYFAPLVPEKYAPIVNGILLAGTAFVAKDANVTGGNVKLALPK